jgi:hypothetical protein
MDTTEALTPTEVIELVREARETEHLAAVAQLELAVEWARLHPCPEGESPAEWGDGHLFDETVSALAGPGAPWVAEFAPVELAAALGISFDAGRQLLGDALELKHRLPRLWDHLRAGRVPVWRARMIARETHDLTLEAAHYADRMISATPERIDQVNATALVDQARLHFDPDRAADDEARLLEQRGVWIKPGRAPATTDVLMTLDTPDAELLDQSITRIAHDLRELGDTDPLDVRRARAAGILADPQHALDLMSGREDAGPTRGGTGHTNLYVHLTPADLTGGTGAATIEKLGAATTDLLTAWLHRFAQTGASIRIRPVLDLHRTWSVDQHDPPETMREQVVLRDAYCVFPGCRHDSRHCDLDHITAYLPMEDGGPPGQTNPLNLAPLCRTHHRVKTFTGWAYKRLDDGSYTWTSSTGHQYDVTPRSRRPPRRP